jgi:hypothetical protein
LQWNSVYGLSSFTYTVAGVFLLIYFDVAPEVRIPLRLEAACMFFQSLATFMADVRNIGRPSAWHPFDRLVATANTIFLACNLIWIAWIERAAYVVIILSGVLLLGRSREARRFGALGTFAAAHALWHLWLPSGLDARRCSGSVALCFSRLLSASLQGWCFGSRIGGSAYRQRTLPTDCESRFSR